MLQSDWFAIRVKSNFEKPISRALRGKGFEDYLPMYGVPREHTGPAARIERPLFPGYVFGRFGMKQRLAVLTIPGVLHIVGVRGVPIPVDAVELASLRAIIESGLHAQPWPFLRTGQFIVVEKGPLAGVEGFVVEVKKNFRLVASINLLQRSVSVEIDRSWVRQIRGDGIFAPGAHDQGLSRVPAGHGRLHARGDLTATS